MLNFVCDNWYYLIFQKRKITQKSLWMLNDTLLLQAHVSKWIKSKISQAFPRRKESKKLFFILTANMFKFCPPTNINEVLLIYRNSVKCLFIYLQIIRHYIIFFSVISNLIFLSSFNVVKSNVVGSTYYIEVVFWFSIRQNRAIILSFSIYLKFIFFFSDDQINTKTFCANYHDNILIF